MDTLLGSLDVRALDVGFVEGAAGRLLLEASLRVTLLLGLTGLAALALRRASATARHGVWCLGVCGALALPLLGALLPAWRLAVLPPAAPARLPAAEALTVASLAPAPSVEVLVDVAALEADGVGGGVDSVGGGGVAARPRDVPEAPPARRPFTTVWRERRATAPVARPLALPSPEAHPVAALSAHAPGRAHPEALRLLEAEAAPALAVSRMPGEGLGAWGWALGLWALGALAVALRLVLARVAVWQLSARSSAVEDGALLGRLQAVSRTLGLERPVRLLESDAVALPITWGVVHPAVLLPRGARHWPAGRLEQVLLHELAHVKRLDALTQLLAQLACAFYWFHPLVWLAERRMRVLREYACDDQVLASGTRASDYAGELLGMVRALGRGEPSHAATLAMARPSQLEGRLRAILDPALPRRAPGRGHAALALLASLALLVPLAAVQPARAAEPPPGEGPVERGAERPAEPRRPRTLPRLSREESARRSSDFAPAPLVPAAPLPPEPPSTGRAAGDDGWDEGDGREDAPHAAGRRGDPDRNLGGDLREERGEERGGARSAPPSGRNAEEALARAVREARGDAELADALTRVLREQELRTEAERQAFLRAAERVRAPAQRGALLEGLLRHADVSEATGRAVLRAARSVDDDAALSRVLSWCHRIEEDEVMHGPLMGELLQTVAALDAPAARGRALRELLQAAPVTEETGRQVLRMAGGLGDDREAGAVLSRMHTLRERELVRGPLARDYLDVTQGLSSEAARARALRGLLQRGPLPRDAALRALSLARALPSEGARREVLAAAGALQADDADVSREVQALAASVPDGERALARGRERGPREPEARGRWAFKLGDLGGATTRSFEELSPEERARVREDLQRAREEVRRAGEEARRAAEETRRAHEEARREALQAQREQARELAEAERERAREQAEAAREQAEAAREQAREQAEAAREQGQRAREEGQRAREEGQRAREEARAEAERAREEGRRGREPSAAADAGPRGEEARARIRAEVERFEKAKQSLRADAARLREEAARLNARMRQQVQDIRNRLQHELQRSGIEDFDVDGALDYDFDVDIDVD